MQTMMAQRCIQPHLQLVYLLHRSPFCTRSSVDAPPSVHALLGDVGAWQLKCYVQCSAVAMLDQTVVTNRTVAANLAADEEDDV